MRAYGIVSAMVVLACLAGCMSGDAADAASSDAGRIAALKALQAERMGPDMRFHPSGLDFITRMEGEMIPGDGGTVPRGTSSSLHIVTPDGLNHVGLGLTLDGNAFHADLPEAGDVTILVLAPGYAPTIHGPVTLHAGATTDGVRIPLEPVVPAHVQFVDESGSPIAGVTAQIVVAYSGSLVSSGRMRFESDEDGLVPIPQGSAAIPTRIEVYRPGFMRERRQDLVVEPNDTLVWTLRAERPFQGRVVDARSGQPIAGAQVSPDFGRPSQQFRAEIAAGFSPEIAARIPQDPEPIASGGDGRFILHELDDSKDHWFVVQADGFGSEYLKVPAGWSDEKVIELAPRTLSGRITGGLENLHRDRSTGARQVSLYMQLPSDFSTFRHLHRSAPVQIEGDEGAFVLRDLPPGTAALTAGPERMEIELVDGETEVEITLEPWQQHPDRAFRLRLIAPEDAPPVDGSLTMLIYPGMPGYSHGTEERVLKIAGGTAETLVPAPSRVTLRWDGIPGYIPAPPDAASAQERPFLIEPDDAPFELDLALERVGAIKVRIDGSNDPMFGFANLSVAYERRRPSWSFNAIQVPHVESSLQLRPGMPEAILMPLPLNASIQLTCESTFVFTLQTREVVTLTRENPIADVTLTLPEVRHVYVSVVDSDGQPLEGEQVALLGEDSGRMTSTTNERGTALFVVSGAQSYIARVEAQGDRAPAEAVAVLTQLHQRRETVITLGAAQP